MQTIIRDSKTSIEEKVWDGVIIMSKEHLLRSLEKGVRYDGRSLLEFRQLTIEEGIYSAAEGSAKVKLGNTELLVGVKMAVEKPYPDTPEEGNLMVNAELTPLSNPAFEMGPPGKEAVEIARVIDRGIREAKAIDAKKLCITKGEEVWSVMIDVCTINAEGNLMDAGGIGAIAALKNAVFPEYKDKIINYQKKTKKKLPIVREPIPVTVFKIGKFFIVDPLPEEERLADARLTIALTKDDTICAMQKGDTEPLSITDIDTMIKIAIEKAKELRKILG